MTLFTLILDSLYAGLLLIAAGWASNLLHARQRHRAARLRASDPFAGLAGPYLAHGPTAGHGRSTWMR
jgi:hypothetical protein